jgi:hypothetical protein
MVLSGRKMTSSLSSIVNRNQGGGEKKMGLAPTANIPIAVHNSYHERGLPISMMVAKTNRYKGKISMNLPVGFDGRIKMY